ncbi:MAG: phosphoribosyltransferase family protein, partial [Chitinophagales bacterium]
MEQTLTRIVSAEKVYQKIKRIAFEIAEDNYDETEIVLAGICKATEGYVFAELLYQELKKITSAHILLTHIELDKKDPGNSMVELNLTEEEIDNKTIILVDDVANTGRTILYAMKPLLSYSPKKIRNAVLVERKHKLFPISPDYVGLSLSTTMHEHIKVVLSDK